MAIDVSDETPVYITVELTHPGVAEIEQSITPPTGTPVAEHIRAGLGKDGKPLRVMVTIAPGDLHTLVYELDAT
jgi:hypothetical protein